FDIIKRRFKQITDDLKLNFDIDGYLTKIQADILSGSKESYAASRGEYLNAIIAAAYLGFDFIDAADIIKFDRNGAFDDKLTDELCSKALSKSRYAVIPGFYGSDYDGNIVTFSRGGSDITGSIIAKAANAELYENWTDVDGFLTADPKIVSSPALIDTLSYRELRELSYMGASVLHAEAVFPVWSKNIPLKIMNVFKPQAHGTMIVPHENYDDTGKVITGIAGKKDFSVIYIEKKLMNNQLGYARKVLSVLEKHNVSFEHIPTGIDTMSLCIESRYLKGKVDIITEDIKNAVCVDNIIIMDGLALIALVGHGMRYKIGTAGRLCGALAKAGININLIDQGSSELSIIIGVDNKDYCSSIQAIYNEFLG
ncbi:MAG: aspartate kinase, partial [Clostridia bacterium]|nr:aspartate kinase [Clostridia bacterium]